MKQLKFLFLGLILSLLSGCWSQHDIEKVGPILQLGVETGKNGRLLVTHSFPVFGMANKNQDELVSMESANLRESREIWHQKSPQMPEGGKLLQYLFSTEFAQNGIYPWLEVFERDPLNPPHANVIVVDGSPKELMEKAALFKDKPRPAIYIHELLGNNREQYAAVNSITSFTIAYFAPGLDPIAPLIKLEPQSIRLAGTAVFAGDKMVGTINTDETILLLAMMGRLRETEYIFRQPASVPGEGRRKPAAAAHIAKVKRRIQIQIHNGHPEVMIHLDFAGNLDEYRWDRMDKPQSQQKLERSFASELEKRCHQLIQYLQHAGSDPLGIGDLIRADYYGYWRRTKPEFVYKTARIIVKTKFKINQYGTIK